MDDEMALIDILEKLAFQFSDGHFTILKFTTNWKVGFDTPECRQDVTNMYTGKTFRQACLGAIGDLVAKALKEGKEVGWL